jgi:hypothetical protein
MKHKKAYIISLLAVCIVCINVMYFGAVRSYDEIGPIDLGSIYNINSMVNS